uniref:Uncharacterized protein n=1 Tax=Glossina pallidipes TaxID=7398 RepID=A0A1A9ZBY8_GLOPL
MKIYYVFCTITSTLSKRLWFSCNLLRGIQLSVSASLLLLLLSSSSTITTRTRAVKMNFTLKRGHYVELSASLSHTYSLLMRPPTIATKRSLALVYRTLSAFFMKENVNVRFNLAVGIGIIRIRMSSLWPHCGAKHETLSSEV